MQRSIHTLCLLALVSASSAQVPSYTTELLPPPKVLTGDGTSLSASAPMTDKMIYVHTTTKKYRPVDQELVDVDRRTQEVRHRTKLPLDQNIEDILVFDGKVFLVSSALDRKGVFDYYATAYRSDDLQAIGERKRFASISFKPGSPNDLGLFVNHIRYRSKFVPNADGSRMAFYCGGASTEKHEQVVFVSLLDGDMAPIWEDSRSIVFTSDNVEEEGVVAAADGSVQVLLRAAFKDRFFTTKAVDYTYEVFRFGPDAQGSRPIELPAGKFAATASIAEVDGKLLVSGGYVEGEKSKTLVGSYAAYLDAAGSVPTYATSPLPLAIELQDHRKATVLPAPDGTSYLFGSSYDVDLKANGLTSTDKEGPLYVVAFDKDLSARWAHVMPRHVNNGKWGTGVKPFLVNGRPVLAFTDHPGNVAAYKNGQAGEARGDERKAFLAAFDAEGVDVAPLEHGRCHLTCRSVGRDLGNGLFGTYHTGGPSALEEDTETGMLYITFGR